MKKQAADFLFSNTSGGLNLPRLFNNTANFSALQEALGKLEVGRTDYNLDKDIGLIGFGLGEVGKTDSTVDAEGLPIDLNSKTTAWFKRQFLGWLDAQASNNKLKLVGQVDSIVSNWDPSYAAGSPFGYSLKPKRYETPRLLTPIRDDFSKFSIYILNTKRPGYDPTEAKKALDVLRENTPSKLRQGRDEALFVMSHVAGAIEDISREISSNDEKSRPHYPVFFANKLNDLKTTLQDKTLAGAIKALDGGIKDASKFSKPIIEKIKAELDTLKSKNPSLENQKLSTLCSNPQAQKHIGNYTFLLAKPDLPFEQIVHLATNNDPATKAATQALKEETLSLLNGLINNVDSVFTGQILQLNPQDFDTNGDNVLSKQEKLAMDEARKSLGLNVAGVDVARLREIASTRQIPMPDGNTIPLRTPAPTVVPLPSSSPTTSAAPSSSAASTSAATSTPVVVAVPTPEEVKNAVAVLADIYGIESLKKDDNKVCYPLEVNKTTFCDNNLSALISMNDEDLKKRDQAIAALSKLPVADITKAMNEFDPVKHAFDKLQLNNITPENITVLNALLNPATRGTYFDKTTGKAKDPILGTLTTNDIQYLTAQRDNINKFVQWVVNDNDNTVLSSLKGPNKPTLNEQLFAFCQNPDQFKREALPTATPVASPAPASTVSNPPASTPASGSPPPSTPSSAPVASVMPPAWDAQGNSTFSNPPAASRDILSSTYSVPALSFSSRSSYSNLTYTDSGSRNYQGVHSSMKTMGYSSNLARFGYT